MSTAADTLCTFVLSQRSVLDTLFVNQTPRRPAYATITDGSVTSLWRIDLRGNLSEVAQIRWSTETVLINGQVMLVDNILQRSKSFFGSDSRTFAAGHTRCKWKSGKTRGGSGHFASTSQQPSFQGSVYTAMQVWTCYETTPSSTSVHSSPPVIALFFPPQTGLIKSELTVFHRGNAIVDHIVLTALLVSAGKDEWRSAQSAVKRTALEASLKAEISGSLPPYAPTTASRYRATSSSHLRRPQSTTAARSRYAAAQPPPPYTSVDDISMRPR